MGGSYYLHAERDIDLDSQVAWVALQMDRVYEPEIVTLPGGRFRMGFVSGKHCNDDELPVRDVTVKTFALGRYEVTFAEYAQFAFSTGLELPVDGGFGRGRRPVINVSWGDAVKYAAWLSERTGKHYRLPTEAEWEYAARAGSQTVWSFGDEESDLGRYAWYWQNSGGKTHPVGEREPNPWGLHDVHGNVYEWAQGCWHGSYEGAPSDGSAWEKSEGRECGGRVVRGGSWSNVPEYLRSASHLRGLNVFSNDNLGFRLAQDP